MQLYVHDDAFTTDFRLVRGRLIHGPYSTRADAHAMAHQSSLSLPHLKECSSED